MDDHQIAFIICTNNKVLLDECLMYISLLKVPDGFTTDVITIEGAESMCAGYNAAMNESPAKYKIYMHQDVYITDRDFLIRLLDVFRSDDRIGMVGLVGAPKLDRNAIMWEVPRVGNLMTADIDHGDFGTHYGEIVDVDCIDGLFMATQHDVPWRDDLFTGYHFYDISQSMEFRRHGYRVVVKDTANDGVIHDDGVNNMLYWDGWRHVCINEYQNMLESIDYAQIHGNKTCRKFAKKMYDNRNKYNKVFDDAISFMNRAILKHDISLYRLFRQMVQAESAVCKWSDNIVRLYLMVDIVLNEIDISGIKQNFLDDVNSVNDALDKYEKGCQMIMRQIVKIQGPYRKEADEYLSNVISETAERMIRSLVKQKFRNEPSLGMAQ